MGESPLLAMDNHIVLVCQSTAKYVIAAKSVVVDRKDLEINGDSFMFRSNFNRNREVIFTIFSLSDSQQ